MIVYFSLGSNLGDRIEHLRFAVQALSQRGMSLLRSSSIYVTEPKEAPEQPWFLNLVLEGSTDLDPHQLLQVCLQVESNRGRQRKQAKGPRTLDIDVIFYGDSVIQTQDLMIPHPRFGDRRFVLEPLAELAPGFAPPLHEKTIRELLEELTDPAVVKRIAPPPV